ncbi:MAG: thiolase family protein [Oligoflexales bacterium]|nr:thiolase family protein [Oligoflexales bacterium]
MSHSVILYGSRTPIGKLSGGLSSLPAPKLGSELVKDAVQKLKLDGAKVDEIIMGQVLSAGTGQAPARQTAIYGGLPKSVCATTLNRVCGSGLKAVMLADQSIRLGDSQLIFAGGQESMSLAPHLLMNSRTGYRFGSVEAKDHMQWDGLWDPYENVAMGNCGDLCAKEFGFSRDEQDAFATESYSRARKAMEEGVFRDEIVPIEVVGRKQSITIAEDEEPNSVDLAKLPKLRPAFAKDGTVTAANASSINDGAALTVLTSEESAKSMGLKPLARIIAQASHAQEPSWFTTAPIDCIKKVLDKAKLKVEDIDLFEINEAFSVVAMAAIKDLQLDPAKVNVYGGAVALGHPIGASGARILVTLMNALRQKKLKRGLATLCIGGGEASAVVIENLT